MKEEEKLTFKKVKPSKINVDFNRMKNIRKLYAVIIGKFLTFIYQ